MNYIKTPVKTSKGLGRQVRVAELEKLDSWTIVWHLVKRHKFGLVVAYALTISVLYFLPFTGDMIRAAILGF